MLAFPYTYKNFGTILQDTGNIFQMTPLEWIFLISYLGMIISAIFFIIPGYIKTYAIYEEKKQKQKKKNILMEILLKKEVEDEISKEMKG